MNSADDVTNNIDPESNALHNEKFQSTDLGNSLNSSKPDKKDVRSLKRKCMDANQENEVKKTPRIDNCDKITDLNLTENDLSVTWYSLADEEEVKTKENISIYSANEEYSNIIDFAGEHFNDEVNCSNRNDKTIILNDAEDAYQTTHLAKPEQEYLPNNSIIDEMITDDFHTKNNVQTSTISNKNMTNQIVDESSVFCEITMTDDESTDSKISSFSKEDDNTNTTTTNNTNIFINDAEINCSLLFSEQNMNFPLLRKNEEYCINNDQQVLSNSPQMADICRDFVFLEALSTRTQNINDESTTKSASINETEIEKLNIDQDFLDYINTNVEPLPVRKKTSNQDKMIEIEEETSNSSKCDTKLMILNNCSVAKIPTISPKDTLAHRESQNSDLIPDFGDIDDLNCQQIALEKEFTEIKLQNAPEEANEPKLALFKNKKQENDNYFGAVYYKGHMDKNIELFAGENNISNKNKMIETEENISNSSRCETTLASFGDNYSAEAFLNTDELSMQQLQNIVPNQKSTEANKLQNAPEQAIETNEEVKVRSSTKEQQPKNKCSSGSKKRTAIQKERVLEQEHGIILDLIKEYIDTTNLKEFTSLDIINFITERVSNLTYFKVLHAVRIFIMKNLKSKVLKKSGQKYTLGYKVTLDISVTNASGIV